MRLPRRQFLHLAAGGAVLPAISRITWVQSYPTRPVHLIVGFPAGGGNDILARLIGQSLSEKLGQPLVSRRHRLGFRRLRPPRCSRLTGGPCAGGLTGPAQRRTL